MQYRVPSRPRDGTAPGRWARSCRPRRSRTPTRRARGGCGTPIWSCNRQAFAVPAGCHSRPLCEHCAPKDI